MSSVGNLVLPHVLPLHLCVGAKVVLLVDLKSETSLCVHWRMLKLSHFELATVVVAFCQQDAILSEECIWVRIAELLEAELD